jgi:hypothetical protein
MELKVTKLRQIEQYYFFFHWFMVHTSMVLEMEIKCILMIASMTLNNEKKIEFLRLFFIFANRQNSNSCRV